MPTRSQERFLDRGGWVTTISVIIDVYTPKIWVSTVLAAPPTLCNKPIFAFLT
jgi:hypothetical protein